MDHFISVIFAKQLNESKRDIVLDTMINTARVGLTEDSVEYELFESEDSSTVLRLPLAKPIKEAHQQAFVEALANRLFDKGHTDFEIELSVLNENLLRQGSRGADVKALQAQLGMPAAEQDGIFGPNTERAVRTFQQSMGLQVDGIVGPQTRTAIANSQAAGAATRDAPYTPQAVPQTPTQQRTAANPQTAAPQTSPRPQARPAQTTAAPTGPTADQRDAERTAAADRSAAQALGNVGTNTRIAPGTTSGGPSRLRQRQMSRANPDATDPRGPDQRNVPSAGATQRPRGTGNATSGATAPGAQGDGLRGNAAVGAGPAQGTTVVGRPNVPVGELPAGEYTSRTVNNQDTARIGQQDDQTIDYTGGADANVGEPGQQGGVDTLRQQRADAQNQAADNRLIGIAQQQRDAKRAADRKAAIDALRGTADAEVVTTDDPTTSSGDGFDVSTLAMDTGQPPENQTTTGRTDAPSGEFKDRAVNMVRPEFPGQPQAEQPPQTQDNAANRSTQVAAQQQADFRARYNDDTSGRDGLPNEFVSQSLDPVLDNLSDAAAKNLIAAADGAPPAVARTIIRDIERTYGPAEQLKDMAREIAQEDPDQASALSRLSDFVASLNTGANETVSPRPKGAFMFRERNEWDAKYSATHNRDGSLKAKTNLIESRKYDEVTYHDDDQFYEDYGVMWYNDDNVIDEAEYQGRKVKLGKPMKGDVKKFKVYVRNPKGNVVKVNFGQKGVKIKKSNPARRRSFRARHNCDNPGPRHKARYWSCRKW